jgi:hypothetical protein
MLSPIAVHSRVTYSARYLASTMPAANFPGHTRGGALIGAEDTKRGVVIGFAPDWPELAYVRWDHEPEVARGTHQANLILEAEIARDADHYAHAPSEAA